MTKRCDKRPSFEVIISTVPIPLCNAHAQMVRTKAQTRGIHIKQVRPLGLLDYVTKQCLYALEDDDG